MSKVIRVLLLFVAVLILTIFLNIQVPTNIPLDKQPPAEILSNDFLLGDYYFNHGPFADGTYDLSLARKHYASALAYNPVGDNIAWYQLGRIDFLEGKFDDALTKFAKQVKYFNVQEPSVYYMIGLTNGYKARKGLGDVADDWKQAENNFIEYLRLNPDSPWGRVDLSWVYFSQGDFKKMLPILEEGLASNPTNPWLLNMYGLAVLNSSSAKDGATTYFEKALQEANNLTEDDWGKSYPGNDPKGWGSGLEEFKNVIKQNLLVSQRS